VEVQDSGAGTNGTVNTGGGAGGGGVNDGGAGGSGLVVVRGPSTQTFSVTPCTNTVSTLPGPAGSYKVATFTVSGTLTVS
jgi:hypothetical protein